ncbi:MAG: hypothetical protein Q9195_007642 [Heterodermia aff. obscurata]
MTGSWPTYYLSAYELKADRTWTKSSGASTGPIAYSEKFKAMAPPGSPESADDVHHQFCALIPNEPKFNGLNVLLVSSYRDKKGINVINFRTYLKDGNPAPAQQPVPIQPSAPAQQPSPTQQPNPAATVLTPLRQGEKYITTEWRGRTVTKVPSSFFTSVDKVTERANLSVVEDSILKPGNRSSTEERCAGGMGGLGKGSTTKYLSTIKAPWYDNTTSEFFYHSKSSRFVATLTYRFDSFDSVCSIANPELLFYYTATGGQLPPPAPTSGLTPPGLPNVPINAIPTVTPDAPPQSRDLAGWSSYIDCVVSEDFDFLVDDNKKHTTQKNTYFHSMGLRLCKVGSTVRGIPMYGVMNVFSFHGVLGVRVYAPTEPGRYENWEPYARGFQARRPRDLYIGVRPAVDANENLWKYWEAKKEDWRFGSWNGDGLNTGQGKSLKDAEGTAFTCLKTIYPVQEIQSMTAGYDTVLQALSGFGVRSSGRYVVQCGYTSGANIEMSAMLKLGVGERVVGIETKSGVRGGRDRAVVWGVKLRTDKGNVWKVPLGYDDLGKGTDISVVAEEAQRGGWRLKGFYGSATWKAVLRIGPVWGIKS